MSRAVAAMLRDAVATLGAAGVDGPGRDARLLLAEVLDCRVERLSMEPERVISDAQEDRFLGLIAARAARQPVAQILGRRAFWSRNFIVTPDVLDPRPETETLIEAALAGPTPARLLDLGTGSGIIAVTLLAEWPQAQGVAVDISPAALAVTAQNAARYNVTGRLECLQSDWFSAVDGQFDLILANPPYIAATEMARLAPETRQWEPELALLGGMDGLAAYCVILAGLVRALRPGGRALLEIGPTQADALSTIAAGVGLQVTALLPDLDQRPRVLVLEAAK